jgi:hypothetical protein
VGDQTVGTNIRLRRRVLVVVGIGGLLAGLLCFAASPSEVGASTPWFGRWHLRHAEESVHAAPDCGPPGEFEGTWYWLRSPDEEKRVVTGLYNRYCIRCHGVDGRGVWDMPDIPDFSNARWQSSRSDGQLARMILEGRGAVMPPFRGTLTLEESWAMARHLRTLIPGTETPRPDLKSK